MATFRRTGKAAPSIVSFEFESYNEAVAFRKAQAILNPSNPFKKGMKWLVSMVNPAPQHAPATKVEDWTKPFASYCEWRGVEGLDKIDAHVEEVQIGRRVHEANEAKLGRVQWAGLPAYVYEQAHSRHA